MSKRRHGVPVTGALTLLVLTMAGCALRYRQVGRQVPEPVALEIGVMTKSDVLARLGAPLLVRRQFDGELFIYRRFESRVRELTVLPILVPLFFYSDGETLRDDLTLLFDRQGILRAVGRHAAEETAEETPGS